MATLPPPTTAWAAADSRYHLTTALPSWLRRRGYRATWPAGAIVAGVAGVPSDATVPPGTTIAQNTNTKTLYRKENGEWKSVNGEV